MITVAQDHGGNILLIARVYHHVIIMIDSRTAIPSAVRLPRVIHSHSHGVHSLLDVRRDIEFERGIAIEMGPHQSSIDIDLRVLVNSLEVEPKRLSLPRLEVSVLESFAIPANASRIVTAAISCRRISLRGMIDVPVMWQVYALPFRVVKLGKLCVSHIFLHKSPAKVEVLGQCENSFLLCAAYSTSQSYALPNFLPLEIKSF